MASSSSHARSSSNDIELQPFASSSNDPPHPHHRHDVDVEEPPTAHVNPNSDEDAVDVVRRGSLIPDATEQRRWNDEDLEQYEEARRQARGHNEIREQRRRSRERYSTVSREDLSFICAIAIMLAILVYFIIMIHILLRTNRDEDEDND